MFNNTPMMSSTGQDKGRHSGGRTAGAMGAYAAQQKRLPMDYQHLRALWPVVYELIRPRRALLALGFVLMVINRLCGLALPASTKFLIDDVLGKQHHEKLLPLVLLVVAATAVQGVTSFGLTQLLSKAAQRLIAELRCKVQAHVGRLPLSYHDANKSGALVSRIMTDVEGVRNLLGTGLVEFAGGLLTSFFSLFILIHISPFMTGGALCFVLLYAAVLRRAFRTIRPIFRARGKINAEVTGRLTESLAGVRVVKGYHAEVREEAVFAAGAQRLLANVLQSLTAVSIMSLSATVLLGVVGATVMYVGASQVISGALTVGGLVTFTAFLGFLVAPVFQVVGIGTQLSEALAGLERTQEVLHREREDDDPRRIVEVPEVLGRIVFEHVSFYYEGGKEALHDISFHAERGTVTALVGPSGAGKSTIIGLICAFYTPTTGSILADGVDLSTVRLDSYRRRLGVVLQETFLFDGTIRENVAFSRPDAREEDIRQACRIARVDEFAERFTDGYDTVIGERGVKLSGGQRQRLSIARALLADPQILILDEATSSLDSESEALIQEGLSYLMTGRTTFVIAHRLSTIRRADQILVLESGRLIEQGTHAELYGKHGRYYQLYTKQIGAELNYLPTEDDKGDPGQSQQCGISADGDAVDAEELNAMTGLDRS